MFVVHASARFYKLVIDYFYANKFIREGSILLICVLTMFNRGDVVSGRR